MTRVDGPRRRRLSFTGTIVRGLGMVAFSLLVGGLAGSGVAADETSGETLTALVKVNPLEVSLLIPRDPIAVGERFAVQVDVHNHGEVRLRDVAVTLHVAEESLAIGGPQKHRQGLLLGGHSMSRPWRLAALESGYLVIVASVSAVDESDGEVIIAESDAALLRVE